MATKAHHGASRVSVIAGMRYIDSRAASDHAAFARLMTSRSASTLTNPMTTVRIQRTPGSGGRGAGETRSTVLVWMNSSLSAGSQAPAMPRDRVADNPTP